jgi:gluconokinase
VTAPSAANDPFVVSLDIGSSSVRALVFDAGGRQVEGYGAQLAHRIRTTAGGGAESDPEELARMTIDCLDEVHRQVHVQGKPVAAIAGSAFWHGLMGTDAAGRPTTPLLHLFDTRSESYAAQLPDASARTGCPRHSSYWPAKLLWLASARPAEFAATHRWMSLPEYLFARLIGRPRTSISMASATGLWNQRAGDYDPETLHRVRLRREQLAPPAEMDLYDRELLLPRYREMWPGFASAAWFPLLGDGAANNLGSGCISPDSFALMVGTTGAMRAVIDEPPPSLGQGLWCYRVDRGRAIIGGALSNGGEVFAWMKRTLALPRDLEARLDNAVPGSHGLVLLPFFSGERTPYWRGDLKAAITGMSFSTEPFDIYRAALESVALGFVQIYSLLSATLRAPGEVVASGGALIRSPGWTQMMADALGRPVVASTELEPSARGAALWALEQLRIIPSAAALPASTGAIFEPREDRTAAFARLAEARGALHRKLFEAAS